MVHILDLFGHSPFTPLQQHMEKVSRCVESLTTLFAALSQKNDALLTQIADDICHNEHAADVIKNDIRNNLPSKFLLSIDRGTFLTMLALQDSIADRAEDIAILLQLRKMEPIKSLNMILDRFLEKNISCFDGAAAIIRQMHELLESSFGGAEAAKVKQMTEEVDAKEHEVDLVQRDLLKCLYSVESQMSYGAYYQWQKIFEAISAISNLSKNLAGCVRMALDIQ